MLAPDRPVGVRARPGKGEVASWGRKSLGMIVDISKFCSLQPLGYSFLDNAQNICKSGFLNPRTLDIWGQIVLCCGAGLLQPVMSSSIPGLHLRYQ